MNAPHETPSFQQFQRQFAARLRDNSGHPLPDGVPSRRMGAYEELVFNNMEDTLASAFPISKKILIQDGRWESLVRRYLAEHQCHEPLFRDISGEFLDWFEGPADDLFPEQPFLWQFMHYEWLELVVSIDPEAIEMSEIDLDGDLLQEVAVLQPTLQLAAYNYPVHLISSDYQPEQADEIPHCYLLFRDDNDSVQFNQITPVTLQLLQVMQSERLAGIVALNQLGTALQLPNIDQFVNEGQELLQGLKQQGVILGTQKDYQQTREDARHQ